MIYDDVFQIIGFLLLLLGISSLVINGIYITTRGEQEKLPNGNMHSVDDMIFYPFYKFFMKEKLPPRKVFYTGNELVDLYKEILKTKPLPEPHGVYEAHIWFDKERGSKVVLTDDGDEPRVFVAASVSLWQEFTKDILESKGIKGEFKGDSIRFYKEYKRYRFSKYIRKPLVQCIRCMASFWGTLIYWPTIMLVLGFYLWEFPVWVVFCFSLSYLNTYLYTKIS